MPYHYTDVSRENDPHALPDVEVWRDRVLIVQCQRDACYERTEVCEAAVQATAPDVYCPCCEYHSATAERTDTVGYWYSYGMTGYMNESDPVGPYETEAEALTAAREAAGCCEHGQPEDAVCDECPAPELWALKVSQNHGAYAGEYLAFATRGGFTVTASVRKAAVWVSEGNAAQHAPDDDVSPYRLTDDEARRWGRE